MGVDYYTFPAATDPQFEGRGTPTGARQVIYAAERDGWNFYPTQQDTPRQISLLAEAITKQMGITNECRS